MLSTGFVPAEHAELAFGETVAVSARGRALSAAIGCRLRGTGPVLAVESVPCA
ncbi:hypothetical protein [Streptomyces sp. NPDC019208]|uniref:hypothetical protein n=1 Tax=unclassified Streptomyces TaxID=2593676 RepID=UPI003407BB7C